MLAPTWLHASRRLVPLGNWCARPSTVTLTVSEGGAAPAGWVVSAMSAIALPADHVHHPEGGDHVGDEQTGQDLLQQGHRRKTRRPHPALPRAAGAVRDDVEAELAVAPLGERVDLSRRDV